MNICQRNIFSIRHRRSQLGFIAACVILGSNRLFAADSAPTRHPNLIIILADDMGYSDPGCYGGEMVTPAIDRLAREGVRLTHFENGGMCVVSRTSLMTGNWFARMKKELPRTPLLSEELHEAGYRTGLIGKWHLRGDPMDRGFDHFFGFLSGGSDHFTGGKDYRLDRAPFTEFGSNYFSANAFSDRAIQFIKSPPPGQEQKPFFLYLSYETPHNPLQAPRADILRNRGKYLDGWQAVREARFKRQKEMGLVPTNSALPDYPQNLPDWKSLTPAQRDLEDLRMSVYAGMIERMDAGIARVMQALEASGQATNTLVLFMSDNGSDPFSSTDSRMLEQDKLPGDPHSNWQHGMGWAYASNTPWRLYKISQHGGGVISGGIAWWPGHTGKPGRIANSPVHMVDVLPTFLAAAGQPPANLKVSGESFLSMIRGEIWQRKNPLYFQFVDNRAIRDGDWTLADVDGQGWELFHTSVDPFENNNLAKKDPQRLAEFDARWLKWWETESGQTSYAPPPEKTEGHAYSAQGDRGSGAAYKPSAMPDTLARRYPISARP